MNSFFQQIITDYHLGFFTLYGLYSAFKDTLFFLFKITLDLPESENDPDPYQANLDALDSESEIEEYLESELSDLDSNHDSDLDSNHDSGPENVEDEYYDREIMITDNSENVDPEYILPGSKKLTINLKKRKKIVIE